MTAMPDPKKLTRPASDVGSGPWCDCCRAEIEPGGVLLFFDRHGDPECLCSGCYDLAAHPREPQSLRRQDTVFAWLLVAAFAAALVFNFYSKGGLQ